MHIRLRDHVEIVKNYLVILLLYCYNIVTRIWFFTAGDTMDMYIVSVKVHYVYSSVQLNYITHFIIVHSFLFVAHSYIPTCINAESCSLWK